jgi:hypothetical protein
MGLVWVLIVILQGTKIDEERVYFNDLDTCLSYASRVREQNWFQSRAGDKIWIKAYCIPQTKGE